MTLGLVAWTWWRRPDIYRPLRNDLVLANLIGFAVFWQYPLAPPRMLAGFVDVVERVAGPRRWHNELISHADQLAAMPSMHLAWACGARSSSGAWPARKPVAPCRPPSPCSPTPWHGLVVMATGNHYLSTCSPAPPPRPCRSWWWSSAGPAGPWPGLTGARGLTTA